MTRKEEIRNAAQAYYPSGTNHEEIKVASFIRGARHADKTMVEKARQWLFENVYDYLNPEDQERVEDFRKAMLGEE